MQVKIAKDISKENRSLCIFEISLGYLATYRNYGERRTDLKGKHKVITENCKNKVEKERKT